MRRNPSVTIERSVRPATGTPSRASGTAMQPAERAVHSANAGAERVKQRAVDVEEDEDAGFQ